MQEINFDILCQKCLCTFILFHFRHYAKMRTRSRALCARRAHSRWIRFAWEMTWTTKVVVEHSPDEEGTANDGKDRQSDRKRKRAIKGEKDRDSWSFCAYEKCQSRREWWKTLQRFGISLDFLALHAASDINFNWPSAFCAWVFAH